MRHTYVISIYVEYFSQKFSFCFKLIKKNAPFLRDQIDLKRSMFFVVLALIPCLSFGVYNVGLQSKISSGIPFSEAINLPLYDLLMIGLLSVVPLYIVTFTVGVAGFITN